MCVIRSNVYNIQCILRIHVYNNVWCVLFNQMCIIVNVSFGFIWFCITANGPLTRYIKLRVAHAPGMPGTFSPSPRISDPDMHHVTHVPWCMSGSLTNSFLWRRWRGKRSQHSRRMRKQQLYVSGKRSMSDHLLCMYVCATHSQELEMPTMCVQEWLTIIFPIAVNSPNNTY